MTPYEGTEYDQKYVPRGFITLYAGFRYNKATEYEVKCMAVEM